MALDLNGECKLNICDGGNESGNRPSGRKEEIWPVYIRSYIVAFIGKVWKLGKEDPRRVIHSVKVGLALSVVSLLYLIDPLFTGVGGAGGNAIWAVLTVVVVHEFTAGATLSKGLNRGFGTLVAGSLGTVVTYLSELAGEPVKAIVIGFTVFFLGAAASFSRFFPIIKRKYDYGVVIFILTFNLIAVSGYRQEIFQPDHVKSHTWKTQSHAQISANAKPRQRVEYAEALPLATFAWLVVEVVARVEDVVEAVEELGNFKACEPSKQLKRATPPQTPKRSKGGIVQSQSHGAVE